MCGRPTCVQHAAGAQVVEGDQHLGRILGHRIDVEPNAAPILLGQLPQVDVLQRRAGPVSVRSWRARHDDEATQKAVCRWCKQAAKPWAPPSLLSDEDDIWRSTPAQLPSHAGVV